MEIIEQIQQAAINHEVATGKKPTNVYLGRDENYALMSWVYDNRAGADRKSDVKGNRRLGFEGMNVYTVNAASHLACSGAASKFDGWHIEYDPKPIPDRRHDYDFWNDDYDGGDGGNGLSGTAESHEDAESQIEQIIADGS